MKYELIELYNKEIRKNIKNKNKVYLFELYKYIQMDYFDFYKPYFYSIFLIFEPKVRVVMSLSIKDKILNHYVSRNILLPKLEKCFDMRNVATRKSLGTSRARELVKKYFVKMKKNSFYILKLDISKYFYRIDHDVLKGLLKNKLNSEEYDIVSSIIDSTNMEYINKRINFLESKYGINLPYYEFNKGLPIGNMTSQILSIFYLNELDHKIVHDYHIPCYVRYMDDFILFHENKDYLIEIKNKIKLELDRVYHLCLNEKKSKIYKDTEGVVFLGLHYKIRNNKVISYLPHFKKIMIRRKIKNNYKLFINNGLSFESLFSSKQCFLYSNKVGKLFVKRILNEQEILFFENGLS